MKIGLVRRGHSATGGAEAYLIRLAAAVAAAGHDPVLITGPEWPEERWIGRPIVRLTGRSPEDFAAAFLAADTGCDIHLSLERVPGCEVFRAGDGVHAAWLRRRAGFEPLWKRATRWLNPKHRQLLALESQVFDPARTRAIIANSELVRREILAHSGFPPGRVHVVYNGLSSPTLPAHREESRRALGVGSGTLCAAFVGSGWDRKGLRTAIDAVEMMEDTELLVAGRGPADAFRSDRARFLGPTHALGTVFGAADIFVLPTYYDPFSNACLEALAAGLPVITTPANGFSEILTPGTHGGIVPEGDALALADELESWRPAAAREASRQARVDRAAEFSIERNARETLAVLEQVIGSTNAPPAR